MNDTTTAAPGCDRLRETCSVDGCGEDAIAAGLCREHHPGPGLFEGAAVISTYTRKQAIADGLLVDVTETAREAGLALPTALTRAVWSDCVAWSEDDARRSRCAAGQDERGRLWDVVWMARCSVLLARAKRRREGGEPSDTLRYRVRRLPRPGNGREQLVDLKLVVSPGDTPEPVITIMQPDED